MIEPKCWKDAFLKALETSPNVRRAARLVGIGRQTAYDEKAADPAFARSWDEAIQGAVDDVEEAAFNRAGLESDTLAIFLLKCHRPEVYAEKRPGNTGDGSQLADAMRKAHEAALTADEPETAGG